MIIQISANTIIFKHHYLREALDEPSMALLFLKKMARLSYRPSPTHKRYVGKTYSYGFCCAYIQGAVEWLVDFTASCVICASLTALVFLIPIVANPALVSLDARFSAATDCRVCGNVTRRGLSNCSWTSCREGCTADIYQCHHVWVMYNPVRPEDCDPQIPAESREAFDVGELEW